MFTLIHEFAHILSLNSTQVDAAVAEGSCGGFVIDEGCVRDAAYLGKFYVAYWDGQFELNEDTSVERYESNTQAFVTEYAATNPIEDFAESFASFVFNKKQDVDQHQAEEKINFFYGYNELVDIRASIRTGLKSFVHKRITTQSSS